jgi:hypothetical protein
MSLRRCADLGASLLAVVLLTCGAAFAAKSYSDRAGDVEGGSGPDIVSLKVSNTRTNVTFVVRFAKAPPLRVSAREGWVDMLLIGVDVPPLGPRPITPGGEWRGANFALGTHGPSRTGRMVRLTGTIPAESRRVATFGIVVSGSTLTFSIPRRALGNPGWFTFMTAAARELADEGRGGGADFAPARGTFRYALTS